METESETAGVRAYKKDREKEKEKERKREKEWKRERVGPLSLFYKGLFFPLFSRINERTAEGSY